MPEYKLINPMIIGELKTTFNENNVDNAAKKSWNEISKYVTGNVPRFGFSLQNTEDDEIYHYMIKEKLNNNVVEYSINKLDIKMNDSQKNKFINYINKLNSGINKQIGGDSKNKDDDDEDDDEIYEKLSMYRKKEITPIYYWWYNPMLYTIYGTGYTSVYIPTLIPTIIPYLEIDVSSAFFV